MPDEVTTEAQAEALVERLRSLYTIQGLSVIGDRCQEAADMIEQQAATIAALRGTLIDWRNCWLCPATDFKGEVGRLMKATRAALKLGEE